jgi:hypothetical protein
MKITHRLVAVLMVLCVARYTGDVFPCCAGRWWSR